MDPFCSGIDTYLIDDCDVTLVGKVDVINGLEIYDHKFSTKLIYGAKLAERIESLTSGFQWRAYLDIFDAHVFTWFLFSSKEVNENSFEIHEIHKFQACHYPDLRKDLEGELALFIDLCRHHLPEKFL